MEIPLRDFHAGCNQGRSIHLQTAQLTNYPTHQLTAPRPHQLTPKAAPVTFRLATITFALLLAASGASQAQSPKPLTRVLLDSDANNELDDQHAIAYMLFSGDAFDVEGITVNRTRGGGDVEQQAREAERVVTLAGLQRIFKVVRGANGSFAEIAPHVGEKSFDGSAAVDAMLQQSRTPGLVLVPVGKLTNVALALKKDPSL